MPFVLDMHMHTVLGAYDSSLQPEDLAAEAKRVGLSGVNITEHDRLWDRHTLSSFRETQSVGSSRVDLQACKLEYSIVSPK